MSGAKTKTYDEAVEEIYQAWLQEHGCRDTPSARADFDKKFETARQRALANGVIEYDEETDTYVVSPAFKRPN
jgi:hypothetical protein